MGFHQTIADIARNILSSHLSDGLLEMFYRQTHSSIIYFNQAESPCLKLIAQHRAIYETILERHSADAVEAVKIYLNYVASSILQDREYKGRNEHAGTLVQNDLKRVQDW